MSTKEKTLEDIKKEILESVKLRVDLVDDESQDNVLIGIIEDVTSKLLSLRFPFDEAKGEIDVLKPRYISWVVRASKSVYDNIGFYNVRQYSENGLSVTFQQVLDGIPRTMIEEIVPFAGGIS